MYLNTQKHATKKEPERSATSVSHTLVLGGACITPAELDAYEGKLVALTLTDGAGIFKRVGPKLPGALAPLRQFESIGGLGSSEIVASEAIDGEFSGVPVMAYARQVLGVLYDV